MNKMLAPLAAMLVTATFAAPSAATAQVRPEGVWRNPANSVHIRVQQCGRTMCGTVIWANARAIAKAREAGTQRLPGTQIFRGFTPVRPGVWSGQVFVPTRGRSYSGTITAVNPTSMLARGCVFGGMLCKSQTWTRIG